MKKFGNFIMSDPVNQIIDWFLTNRNGKKSFITQLLKEVLWL